MSRLNPNAGEFVPSFGPAIAAPAAPVAATALSGAFSPNAAPSTAVAGTGGDADVSVQAAAAAGQGVGVALSGGDDAVTDDSAEMTGGNGGGGSLTYPIEFLLKFKSLCDITLPGIPDIVRAPPPAKKLGRIVNKRIAYSVQEMLQFQSLYTMMPVDIAWSEILVSGAETDKKSKLQQQAKANKQKEKSKRQLQMQYDPSLVCYFNPTEYAAAMGLYTGPPAADADAGAGTGSNGGEFGNNLNGKAAMATAASVNPIEEAVIAKRRLATLLDDVGPETISSILDSFQEITITCTHTLQEVIGLLFDHAIADPLLCDSYAQLCSGISEKTPEFKEGAKTINFRRILLTRCYEALVEEPEVQQQHSPNNNSSSSKAHGANGTSASQHSWRRRCMLRNVRLIGELFRRQLLTENVMHVCVAMMLDDEVKPQAEIIEAACELIALVGDLLDGSSPASRRTMDEYFTVLNRLRDNSHLPVSVKKAITEMTILRSSGWTKKRDAAPSPAKAAVVAVQAPATIPVVVPVTASKPAPVASVVAAATPVMVGTPAPVVDPVVAPPPVVTPAAAPAPVAVASPVITPAPVAAAEPITPAAPAPVLVVVAEAAPATIAPVVESSAPAVAAVVAATESPASS